MKKPKTQKPTSKLKPEPKSGQIKKFEIKLQFNPRKVLTWILIGFLILSFVFSLRGPIPEGEKGLAEVLNDIKQDRIEKVEIEGDSLYVDYKDNGLYLARKEPQVSFDEILSNANIDPASVNFEIRDQSMLKAWGSILEIILPVVLTGIIFLWIFKQARGTQDSIFAFGRSKAKLFAKGKQSVKFSDVGGVDEAKKELEEVVDFLKHPKKYRALGARTPKGVLLVGPSGTGKTLLAQAVAGEANVPFFSMAGSEFMEMLVGVGASVTGDTPVLIRQNGKVKLLPISEFVDSFYNGQKKKFVVPVQGIETLGFSKKITKFWGSQTNKRMIFDYSSWQSIIGVFRHKVDKIYEIDFLGGKLQTTGDHSVFVRRHGGIESCRVDELKKRDILVNLPMNTREWNKELKKTVHKIKKHKFEKEKSLYLDVWNEDENLRQNYEYALEQQDRMCQYEIAQKIGVCQMTVSNWQRQVHLPQLLSRKLVKLDLPERVKVSPELMKLFGYYTAEGRGTTSLEFTFGRKEKGFIKECCCLIKKVFDLTKPVLEETKTNTVKIKYYSAHLGRFFSQYCGNGSHNKHVPDFIWDLPTKYFLAFLEGYSNGDGYITKPGKLSCSSVSRQLILELAWLCSMHGIKVGIKHEIIPGGRVIRSKPLPDSEVWTLIIGKTSNPFLKQKIKYPYQFKKCYVRKVVKKKFNGFVYDLCGVENEAFFGGEKPILLHNSRVRDLFKNAKKAAPSIIFIDEIDAIGRVRGLGTAGGHDEREQTLNQILVEMDGFTPNDFCMVVAATNRGDLLDPALMRPGRFDRRVTLDLPDIEGRKKILAIHSRGKPFEKGVDWDRVARRVVGFSGADLENMLNEAAILAARENKKTISWDDIEEAATKVKLGPEKKRLQTDMDRKMTAYHEAGHSVVTYKLPKMDAVHRVSIVSRGMTLGYTLIPPKKDRIHETKSHLLQTITSLLGGRAAEEIIFKEFTSGASSDITRATQIARKMVIEYGMSDLGPVNLGPQIDVADWGRTYFEPSQISSEMAAKVDNEIKKIVDDCYKKAVIILKENRVKMDRVVKELLKKETIEGEEFKELMEEKKEIKKLSN